MLHVRYRGIALDVKLNPQTLDRAGKEIVSRKRYSSKKLDF